LHVQQALERSALVPDGSDVTADTKDGIITLTGHVRTRAEHDAVVGAAMTPARARRRTSRMAALLCLVLVAGLITVAWEMWAIVQAPGQALNYAQLAWGLLLVAFPVSALARGVDRVTVWIGISGVLVGVAVSFWRAAQAPGDWVNYLVAGYQFLLLAWWLVSRRARARRHDSAHSA
jgi:hypothetical protein